jgi:aspartate aminotransferase-like enzyme
MTSGTYTQVTICLQYSLSLNDPFSSESHVGPAFVKTFGEALKLLRQLFQTTSLDSQPFVISGSGTLGWDLVA